ncbi:unnamed protein product, partial [Prorocentrum cordatum]
MSLDDSPATTCKRGSLTYPRSRRRRATSCVRPDLLGWRALRVAARGRGGPVASARARRPGAPRPVDPDLLQLGLGVGDGRRLAIAAVDAATRGRRERRPRLPRAPGL